MITEDYVSFKVAKLLKEKGFDELCYACYEYFESGVTLYKGWQFEYKGEPVHNTNERVKCPTLQMAMKWLREVYNIHIEVGLQPHINVDMFEYYIKLFNPETSTWVLDANVHNWDTYEEACEAAIKYCLKNLVNNQ